MFKKRKAYLGVIIAFSMLLSLIGCSTEGDNKKGSRELEQKVSSNVSAGSGEVLYSEVEFAGDAGLNIPGCPRANSDNNLIVFKNSDGKSMSFAVLDREGKLIGEIVCAAEGFLRNFCLDERDNLYVLSDLSTSGKNEKQQLYRFDKSGRPLGSIDLNKVFSQGREGGVYVTDLAADSDGRIFLADPMKNIQVLDNTGKLVKSIGTKRYYSIDSDHMGSIVAESLDSSKELLEKFDSRTGERIWSSDISRFISTGSSSPDILKVRFGKDSKVIYANDDTGIARFDGDGKGEGYVLAYTDFSILAGGCNISSFSADYQEDIYVAAEKENKLYLYKYTKLEKPVRSKNATVLTVSVPCASKFLDIAASRFKQINPDCRVVINAPSEDERDDEKYVRVLNTEILAGKGPDLFSVSGLPFEKYVSKNILADLGDIIEKDKNPEAVKYYKNILDALKIKGILYSMPVSFSFHAMAANSKILKDSSVEIGDSGWKWDDFEKVAKELEGHIAKGVSVLPGISCRDLLDMILKGNCGQFIDKEARKADFSNPGFIRLLNIAKKYGNSNLNEENSSEARSGLLMAIAREAVVFCPDRVSGFSWISLRKSLYSGQLRLLNLPSQDGKKTGAFSCDMLLSVNNKTGCREEAFEFIKFLLSDEMQCSPELTGFAVKSSIQAKRIERWNNGISSAGMVAMGSSKSGSRLNLSFERLTEQDIRLVDNFIGSLSVYSDTGNEILKIIEEEAEAYFDGIKTADDTVKLIQDRVNLYLGE
jgi:ABC-type glycerol-3-phosphate transport system substrate-binding protein